MTDATFQTNTTDTNPENSLVADLWQAAITMRRALLYIAPSKRPVDAEAILAAQARRENARHTVNNLLR